MASQNQIRKNPSIPRIRPRFHNRVRSLQSGLAQLCRLRHTATGHMCQCARVGATARRAVDLHPALFSLLCRERVGGCGAALPHALVSRPSWTQSNGSWNKSGHERAAFFFGSISLTRYRNAPTLSESFPENQGSGKGDSRR